MLEDNVPSDFKEWIKVNSGKIVITTHHKPDGDAIGSSLGLQHFLSSIGVRSNVIVPSDYAPFLHWLPGNDAVINFQKDKENAVKLISEASIVICLDYNSLSRSYEMKNVLSKTKAKLMMIDHHRDPSNFDHFRFWNHNASSTCELIYEFISTHFDVKTVDQNAATCLYTGIMTDTGSFRFNSTTSDTHKVVAALVDAGANGSDIHQRILDTNRLERLKFLGFYLSERIEVLEGIPVALSYLTAEDLVRFNVQTGDTEGFVNYGLSLEGVEMAALIVDRSELIKMSFRSKTNFPCNEFAAEFFNGGGHKNAAGGGWFDSLDNTLDRFKAKIIEYKGW